MVAVPVASARTASKSRDSTKKNAARGRRFRDVDKSTSSESSAPDQAKTGNAEPKQSEAAGFGD
jgi:hypothetical protein